VNATYRICFHSEWGGGDLLSLGPPRCMRTEIYPLFGTLRSAVRFRIQGDGHAQKPSNSEDTQCNAPSSEPFRIYMETAHTTGTLVNIYRTSRLHIQECNTSVILGLN
jgi:hypothetical protein